MSSNAREIGRLKAVFDSLMTKQGELMDAQLPNSFNLWWIIAGVLSLLPLVTTALLAFILREAVKIRRLLEKND
jgi:hypothetical protein